MNKSFCIVSDIYTWEAGPGSQGCGINDYCYCAEVKIIDKNGETKFIQANKGSEVCSLSVSKHSLHDFDADNLEKTWSWDSCDECFDTIHSDFDCEDEDEDINEFDFLLNEAKDSIYHSTYVELVTKLKEAITQEKT